MQAKDFLKKVIGVREIETMDFIGVENAMIEYADYCLAQYVASRPHMSKLDKEAMRIIHKAANEIKQRNK